MIVYTCNTIPLYFKCEHDFASVRSKANTICLLLLFTVLTYSLHDLVFLRKNKATCYVADLQCVPHDPSARTQTIAFISYLYFKRPEEARSDQEERPGELRRVFWRRGPFIALS